MLWWKLMWDVCSELGCNSVNWMQRTTVPNCRPGGMKPIFFLLKASCIISLLLSKRQHHHHHHLPDCFECPCSKCNSATAQVLGAIIFARWTFYCTCGCDILVAHWTVYCGLSHKSGPCNRASSVQNLRSRGRSFYTCRLAERDNFLNFMQFSAAGISSVSRFFQRTCRHRVDKYLFGQNGLTIGLLQTSLPR